jgi:GT2 family glycosyltransferase
VKLAIIIVTYNGAQYIEPLFATLTAHTDSNDTVVIVVDNASSDGTLTELEKASAALENVILLPQQENTGFARGNNIGLQKARELGVLYSLLLNQDMELTPRWLEPLLAVLDERDDVAAAQPMIFLHDEPDRLNSAGNELHFCGFGYCGAYREQNDADPQTERIRSVAFASGAALLLRMAALDRSGDFDERWFMYHEDTDLQIRLRQLGYDCVVVPTSRVLHKYAASFSPRKYALLERNRWLLLLKDWPATRLILAVPALAGVEVAVLVFAAKQGWFRQKLATYADVVRLLPGIVADRKLIQARRVRGATDAHYLTGALHFEGFDHPLITRVANPALAAYWSLVRRIERAVAE